MFRSAILAITLLFVVQPVAAQDIDFPKRKTVKPETTNGVPHVQIGISANSELNAQLLRRVAEFPGVVLGPTRVSLPGATGFQLRNDVKLAHPEAIVGGREFAHLHPDGSLHASLHPQTAQSAIEAGWATPHPWANRHEGWEGFVMIYTPQTEQELEVVFKLVKKSYAYVTGRTLK